MKKSFFVYGILLITTFTNAKEINCNLIQQTAEKDQALYFPRLEKRVSKQGKIYFHSAPHSKCKMPKTFIIKDDYVIAYSNYHGYDYVMFPDNKGNYITGWVEEKALRTIGKMGWTD